MINVVNCGQRKAVYIVLSPHEQRKICIIGLAKGEPILRNVKKKFYGALADEIGVNNLIKIIALIYQKIVAQPYPANSSKYEDAWIGEYKVEVIVPINLLTKNSEVVAE